MFKSLDRPEGVEPYVFGSALNSRSGARDLDVLLVYDKSIVASSRVYAAISPLLRRLQDLAKLPVDPIVLSQEEERAERFIELVGAIPLTDWLCSRHRK